VQEGQNFSATENTDINIIHTLSPHKGKQLQKNYEANKSSVDVCL
jgi:hypothetical protein